MDERVDMCEVFHSMFGGRQFFACNGEFIDEVAYRNEARRRNAYVGVTGSGTIEYTLYVGPTKLEGRRLIGVSPGHTARIVDAVIQWTTSEDSPEQLWKRVR